MPGLPEALRALRYRNYRLFFSGQLISLIGTWMQTVAQSWLVYRLTGQATMLGFVAFAGQIPVFLLATVGGLAADHMKPHRLIVITQSASMGLTLILALLTLTGHVHLWHIIATSLLLGIVNAFDIPARQVFVAQTVGRTDLMNAIALNSSMFNGARILGPAVAGVLVASVGEGWCFLINSVSYLAVIAGLLAMHLEPAPSRPAPSGHSILEGFRYVRRTRPVRDLLLLLGLISLLGMPYSVLMPIFAGQILHGGARALGTLMGASGVGALAGAVTLALRPSPKGLGTWIAACASGFGAALIAFSLSRTFPLSVLLMLPVGFGMIVQMASSNTLIQMMVPDALRGRVMSVYSMMFMGMAPIGALLGGTLAHHLGAPLTVALGGAGCFLGGLVFALRLPAWRQSARTLFHAQEAARNGR
ncbi:MFS transporter [Geothrix fuzhouensis]|uniref:MFS transporter n=1 Tax=Geothrix fuzhouensis TaxID=2966451 RepID=UPI0021489DAB|nr:MFS transporter [Geothrix fuzhouensis]